MTTAEGSRLPSTDNSMGVRDRITANPRPALVWAGVAAALVGLQFGALVEFVASFGVDSVRAFNGLSVLSVTVDPAGFLSVKQTAAEIPRLLSRETIPGHGLYSVEQEEWITGPVYQQNGEWVGTFMGLEPKHAWLVRVVVVYLYSFATLGWVWVGYNWYRRHYRVADWTPRDDVVDRFRSHRWGQFGLLVIVLFGTIVVFGPAMAPTTNAANNVDPYSYQITYTDAETGELTETTVGAANTKTISNQQNTVGPWTYDQFGRFHPFGTMPNGQDLFTFLMYGARLSITIGLLTVGLSTALATAAALLSAYYKGYLDLGMVLVSDAIFALPGLLLLIMLSVLLGDTWIARIYDGGLLLALIFAGTGWPGLWRAIRGPAFQTAEREWIDAAQSFGQHPFAIMRKHILPYITGYLLVYGSMSLGGIIIGIAGLSFLGLGITPPTPEWGRAVSLGQEYIQTSSWHISIIPGVMVTIVVIGFNALGDGVRDAIDPESDAESADAKGADRGGGA